MVGRTLGQYRIEERLGKGGMGTVYRAFDTRLKRDVAVKILSRSEESRDELARLLAEARAAAPLGHPAIATIYEVGEVDDVSFIAMELVRGRTLRESFASKTCELRTLARIGMEVARGLQAAHQHGVIHGDVKPDNLMFGPEDRIKILDFGIARRSTRQNDATLSAGDVQWSEPGKVAGTLSYMAPEQLRGENIDGRADLYALGVVLHELATGKLPYEAESAAAMMAQVLSDAPAPLEDFERDRHPELVRVVRKLLVKDQRERYQSAREVETDLKSFLRSLELGKAAVADPRLAVAVLPFQLLAGPAEDGFLSVALAEAVAHGLSQQKELAVRPTSAVTRYAARAVDPLLAARELNVQVVVEGSIQKVGEQLRVQVQAWDAAHGSTLLSVKLDGRMADLFGLQDRLGDSLASGLGLEDQLSPIAEAPTRDPRAYELYLRASDRLLRWSQWDTRAAIDLLRSAVSLDPSFAAGWARLSAALVDMAVLFDPDPKWYLQAEETVERALGLDPANPEAWVARGRGLWSPAKGFRNAEALRDLAKAGRHPARPHDAPLWTGGILLHIGLHEEARSSILEALEEQPDDQLAILIAAEIETYEGDYVSALEYYSRALALEPSSLFANLWLPNVSLYLGQLEKAEQAIVSGRNVVGEDSLLGSQEALLWAKRGEPDRAEELLRRALEGLKSVSHAHHTHHYAAAALATIGQPERALEQLRRAAEKGLPNYRLFLTDPHIDPLRERSDFRKFMAQLKRDWEAYRREFGSGVIQPPTG